MYLTFPFSKVNGMNSTEQEGQRLHLYVISVQVCIMLFRTSTSGVRCTSHCVGGLLCCAVICAVGKETHPMAVLFAHLLVSNRFNLGLANLLAVVSVH